MDIQKEVEKHVQLEAELEELNDQISSIEKQQPAPKDGFFTVIEAERRIKLDKEIALKIDRSKEVTKEMLKIRHNLTTHLPFLGYNKIMVSVDDLDYELLLEGQNERNGEKGRIEIKKAVKFS